MPVITNLCDPDSRLFLIFKQEASKIRFTKKIV